MKIGFAEIVIVSIVAFLAFGPEKFPQFANAVGKAIREVKILARDLSNEIQENVAEPLRDVQKSVKESFGTERVRDQTKEMTYMEPEQRPQEEQAD